MDRRPFSILGDLRIIGRRQDGAVNSSLGCFKFDDHILSNLLLNYTKPVCIEEFFKLKSEIAQLVYTHVDLMLFDKTRYERKSRELFDDLGLRNPEYNHMYERKRALKKAVAELVGIRLSSGTLRDATIEKTKDGKDYKVSFQKAGRQAIASEVVPDPVVINNYSKAKDPLVLQGEQLVQHFHKVFHGVDAHAPQSKETDQALSLVTQHGLERARHIVEFALKEAVRTNYQVQHFGAVLSYTSRGLADWGRQRPQAAPWRPVLTPEKPDAAWTRGERRVAALTPEQHQARLEKAKAELREQNPFLAQHWKDGNPTFERMIRYRIIRELATEPMDLTIPPPWLTAIARWPHPAQNLRV